jgi:hypothetical protein
LEPLPFNFHRTFKPERAYIGKILTYAALQKEGTIQEIAAETGIPTGVSSGKVEPTIDYAVGMGLVTLAASEGKVRKPRLTPFGIAVLSNDPNLGYELTQWLAHMNLCRSDIGAAAWHALFARGRSQLGACFSKAQLKRYLVEKFGSSGKKPGPLITTYSDEYSLDKTKALVEEEGGRLVRKKAPTLDVYGASYSAMILTLMDSFFPDDDQVSFCDFNELTGWFDVCLWDQPDLELAFSAIERKGHIIVDRHRRPWILERNNSAAAVWPTIYDDMA